MSMSYLFFFHFLMPTKRILVNAFAVHTLKAQDIREGNQEVDN